MLEFINKYLESMEKNTINIRPGVEYLSILSAINYTPWHATSEFVDNSVQSYLDNKSRLRKLHSNYKLKIDIYVHASAIEVKDNAAGIDQKNYERAFQAAMRPTKQTGLSEFGMGMKTAAGWFSNLWTVTSKAIGEDFATEAKLDFENVKNYKKYRSREDKYFLTNIVLNSVRDIDYNKKKSTKTLSLSLDLKFI